MQRPYTWGLHGIKGRGLQERVMGSKRSGGEMEGSWGKTQRRCERRWRLSWRRRREIRVLEERKAYQDLEVDLRRGMWG